MLHDLGAFLTAMVNERGQVLRHVEHRRPAAPVPATWNQYFTGEVFWALALLHRTFPDAGYDAAALRIADYLATERDDVEGWWPDVADHWAAYGFAAMTTLAGRRPARPTPTATTSAARWGSRACRSAGSRSAPTAWFSHYTRGRQTLGAGMGTIGEALDRWAVVAGAVPAFADVGGAHRRPGAVRGRGAGRPAGPLDHRCVRGRGRGSSST